MALTRKDIIKEISERLDLPSAEAKAVLKDLLETMKSTLASKEKLTDCT